MAFNLGDRFPRSPYPYRCLEPCSYQSDGTHKPKINKAPFLSASKRNTNAGNRIWTHAIYHADPLRKIPNCASLKSKIPRFPYEALSKEDIEAILCRCGMSINICGCSDDNEKEVEEICGAKQHRRIFKGPPPRAVMEGISIPSRRDHGYEELFDGTYRRIYVVEEDRGPPFYDAKVIESTAFYRGCKWSRWRSTRTAKYPEEHPGPADYNIVRQPTAEEICAEKVRAEKRKYSKQLRYIELIQNQNILEGHPGPSSYSPKYCKDPELKSPRPKAERFQNYFNTLGPGPAAHWIKRDFDLPEPPPKPCLARLPEPPFFGIKAKRFKEHIKQGPSPATYNLSKTNCNILNCSPPPFGSSAQRFKKTIVENEPYEEEEQENEGAFDKCPKPTWEFKSKTIRMKPLEKQLYEQSPADLPLDGFYLRRPVELQYIAPFHSSEGRFQPWYNWLSVYGKLKTPGPGYYNLEKYKCLPAVCHGPTCRADRFPDSKQQSPAPNEYKVGGGVETVLTTYNTRLKQNMENKHKFYWKPQQEDSQLSYLEQEAIILEKAIASLNVNAESDLKANAVQKTSQPEENKNVDTNASNRKPKLLRHFLYRHLVEPGF